MKSSAPRAALWTVWGLYTALTWVAYANVPPCPDHATFDYIGWLSLHGSVLYVDVIEQNWPGAMWLHTLSTWLCGNHLWSFRAFDYGVMLAGAAAMFRLLRQHGRELSAFLFVPLYQGMYVTADQWVAGQRDVVAAHMLVIACVCFTERLRGGSRAWTVPYGLLLAFATLTRPTYLVFGLLLFGVDFAWAERQARARLLVFVDHVAAGVVVLASLGAVAIAGLYSGGLHAWYEAAVLFNTQLYSRSATAIEVTAGIIGLPRAGWHWYLVLASIGALLWWRRGERWLFGFLAALFGTALISYYVQLKGFGYHLGAWLIVLAAFTSELLAWAGTVLRDRRRGARTLLALAACGIVALGMASKLRGGLAPQLAYAIGLRDKDAMHRASSVGIVGVSAADVRDAARFARVYAGPGQTVLVWGRGALINFLAQRRMPVPFATVGALEDVRPPFVKAELWLANFERMLRERPPRVIFVPGRTAGEEYVRFMRSSPPRAVGALHNALRARYRLTGRFGAFDAYILTAAGQGAGARAAIFGSSASPTRRLPSGVR